MSNYFVWFGKLIESDVFIGASFGWSERTGGGFFSVHSKTTAFIYSSLKLFYFLATHSL